jgi:hypothetical protein
VCDVVDLSDKSVLIPGMGSEDKRLRKKGNLFREKQQREAALETKVGLLGCLE